MPRHLQKYQQDFLWLPRRSWLLMQVYLFVRWSNFSALTFDCKLLLQYDTVALNILQNYGNCWSRMDWILARCKILDASFRISSRTFLSSLGLSGCCCRCSCSNGQAILFILYYSKWLYCWYVTGMSNCLFICATHLLTSPLQRLTCTYYLFLAQEFLWLIFEYSLPPIFDGNNTIVMHPRSCLIITAVFINPLVISSNANLVF